MSRADAELQQFRAHWKEIWQLTYPYAFETTDREPSRAEEESLNHEKELLLRLLPDLARKLQDPDLPKAARECFQHLRSLRDLKLYPQERETFRRLWSAVNERLALLEGGWRPAVPRKPAPPLALWVLAALGVWKLLEWTLALWRAMQ